MENTGVFKSLNATMTSLLLLDSDSTSLTFKKDEQTLLHHLDSISDTSIKFSNDKHSALMPCIELKASPMKSIDYWQKPYIRKVKKEY